ncbi:MAG: ornithine cyclodeaminase family protein [Betaproteobacteria bacterium]|nr:ornithine cyclodeaminase family protein [Betaproteobacteria bacterium]NBO45113.1 ornithine cyclodeaminase family protein [Betaproteobacteria bacterium]NBP11372.1 ornithine cyclodeaminase family protein [Betaproteobacteria bacterium]NBP61535.1 ornithine cyclodeaminase family protein [Betaproteobacteria bacterium]NBQ09881.1 ornithine cyclodeaminase family protein [Betaproteobacteria bacterium]
MQNLDAQAVAESLPYPQLLQALAEGLKLDITTPPRSIYHPNHDASCFMVMPAWRAGKVIGVKLVSVWPDNPMHGLAAVSGVYVLLDAQNGHPVAVIDGTELTLRRTAAAAALAAKLLARADSSHLLVVGTGALSLPLALAHHSALRIERVTVYGRRKEAAQRMAERMQAQGLRAAAASDLEQALALADVVAVATTASQAFIRAEAVSKGTHLGLVGAFTPQMAEAEPALMARARVFADQRQAVLDKGGEVYQAIEQGFMTADDLVADLQGMLLAADHNWRRSDGDITVYKSVGFAALDLIAAELVMGQARFQGYYTGNLDLA